MMTIFFGSQTLAVLAELALEDADGARPADVVGHENVDVHPDVVARLDMRLAAGAREDFFGQSHKGDTITPPARARQMECRGSNGPSLNAKDAKNAEAAKGGFFLDRRLVIRRLAGRGRAGVTAAAPSG